MGQESLGLIETRGFVAAIVAADAATKAADVRLHAYDLIDGGLVTVHVRGEVAAVRAAVEAGAAAAKGVGRVIAEHVIPRLHDEADQLVPPLAGTVKPLLRPSPTHEPWGSAAGGAKPGAKTVRPKSPPKGDG